MDTHPHARETSRLQFAGYLLKLLFSNDMSSADGVAAPLSESDWREVAKLAVEWKVAAPVLAKLNGRGLEPTPEVIRNLRHAYLRAQARSARLCAQAAEAAQALADAGVAAAAFKGIAAISYLYGDARRRAIQDADLLIHPEQLRVALRALERLGYAKQGNGTLEQYLDFVANAPGFGGNRAIALHGPGEAEIDLHWSVEGSGLTVEEILEGARPREISGGIVAPVASPEHCFLLTIHHTVRENFAVDATARDLLDASRWCQYFEREGNLDQALRVAKAARLLSAAHGVTRILSGLDPPSAAARILSRIEAASTPGERRSAARLAELFHFQLKNGPLPNDVFYLVHHRPVWQIVSGLARDWTGYWRSMNAIETQLNENVPITGRLARLVQALPGVRGLRLARELARLKYRNG